MVLRNTNCELTAICDILPKESLALGSYDVPYYNDHLKMLNSHQEIDVVCVCTPNGSHSDISISVLKHDKHVVIEKPIGLTVANCEKVIFYVSKQPIHDIYKVRKLSKKCTTIQVLGSFPSSFFIIPIVSIPKTVYLNHKYLS